MATETANLPRQRKDLRSNQRGNLSSAALSLLPALLTLAVIATGAVKGVPAQAPPTQDAPTHLSNEETQALVKRVLNTELVSAQDSAATHPMQYRLRKMSPRLSTTKLIVETKD